MLFNNIKLIKLCSVLLLAVLLSCIRYPDEQNIYVNDISIDTVSNKYSQTNSNTEDKDIEDKWDIEILDNGIFPEDYKITSVFGDNIHNYLAIQVGGEHDVALKLMNFRTDNCIRFHYIKSNTKDTLLNLPFDLYYIKLASGKKWISIEKDGKKIGKFEEYARYEKGTDILEFKVNLLSNSEGYEYSNFSLKLDILILNIEDEFNSQPITEDEFNR